MFLEDLVLTDKQMQLQCSICNTKKNSLFMPGGQREVLIYMQEKQLKHS